MFKSAHVTARITGLITARLCISFHRQQQQLMRRPVAAVTLDVARINTTLWSVSTNDSLHPRISTLSVIIPGRGNSDRAAGHAAHKTSPFL